MAIEALSGWTKQQKSVVIASFLGWTLDAFDFFVLVFVIKDIAKEFGAALPEVALAIALTLALRPVGAFLFGRFADRFGRRPVLMTDVLLYSVLGVASGFAPSLVVLLILRSLFGIAMGGEWGIGASLTMESIPPKARGMISGLLQCGYSSGYLLASVALWTLYPHIGWRGMFMLGAVPALLVLYIRRSVTEPPGWKRAEVIHTSGIAADIGTAVVLAALIGAILFFAWPIKIALGLVFVAVLYFLRGMADTAVSQMLKHWKLALFAIVLMTAFNFLSHGTQDLYPTFLQVQHGFSPAVVGAIAVTYNIGAILGGIFFGTLSERIGRRRTIIITALLALPVIPFWVLGETPVALAAGAFLLQIAVQGAWGVIPAYLNEISPPTIRATFPGLTYQLGNLFASVNAVLQTTLAVQNSNDFRIPPGGGGGRDGHRHRGLDGVWRGRTQRREARLQRGRGARELRFQFAAFWLIASRSVFTSAALAARVRDSPRHCGHRWRRRPFPGR